ncbi:ATPase [Pseudomonas sp. HR96]|uniref:ATPase n=1 Tax=Pseudomonas sp. HR96 TaxID=1027966 RepID=UPI002A74D757|nr:ATPase [Pseudomonas sp. HR96]WPO99145.1 ATPase [Pseudomonas sp. HR96]
MRRDASDDFDDHLPSLRADERDHEFEPVARGHREREPEALYSRTSPVVRVKAPMMGALWALIGALSIALLGLGWWSFQHLSMMQAQLVATQESFARISEDAAGRLQAISGKVANTETSANSGAEALKARVEQLQAQLEEQARQQQQGVMGLQSGLGKRLEDALAQANAQATAQQAANEQLAAQVKTLTADLATLKAAQGDRSQLEALGNDVAALKKQGNPSARLEQIEQDLVVLKSEQDNRAAAPAASSNTAEFDSFRGQVTRNIIALQSQVQNLQQQINSRQ